MLPSPTPADAGAPERLSPQQVREWLGLPSTVVDDDRLERFVTVVEQRSRQYHGLPAMWMTMAEVDERRGSDLIGSYIKTVEADQTHQHEMDRNEHRTLKTALWSGLAVLAVVAVAGIYFSAQVPEAARWIMLGVGALGGFLAAPRIIEAWRGGPSPAGSVQGPPQDTEANEQPPR